jgi:hypothetical protein
VTFQEFEPYYTRKGDLDQFLEFSMGNESGCELNSGTNDGGIQGGGNCWNNSSSNSNYNSYGRGSLDIGW